MVRRHLLVLLILALTCAACVPQAAAPALGVARSPRKSEIVEPRVAPGVFPRTVRDVKRRGFTFKGSKTGLPGLIDSVRDVGGYKELKGGDAPADRDHDGMADAWERQNQLNPDDASDGAKDGQSDGYTNLERYLNSIPLTAADRATPAAARD